MLSKQSSIKIFSLVFFYILLVIIFDTLPLSPRLQWGDAIESGTSNIIRQFLLLIGLVLFYTLAFFSKGFRVLQVDKCVFFIFLYLFLSAYFLSDYSVSLRYAILSFLVFHIMSTSYKVLGLDAYISLVSLVVISSVLFSMMLIPFSSSFHLPSDPEPTTVGAFRGAFYHKNTLGGFSAFSSFLCCYYFSKYRSIKALFILLISVVCLILTRSVTSIFLLFFVVFLGFFLSRYLNRKIVLLSFLLVYLLSIFLVVSLYFINMDNPSFLSGREEIWINIITLIKEKPFFGYGYFSLFNVGNVTAFGDLFSGYNWLSNVASAHNGYLELVVSIGFFGFFIFLFCFVWVIFNNIYKKRMDSDLFMLCFYLFAFVMLHNFMETSFLNKNKPVYIILVFLYMISYGRKSRE